MAEICKQWAPNVWAYRAKFITSCEATVQMFLIAGAIALVLGALFGIVLAVTRKGGIAQTRSSSASLTRSSTCSAPSPSSSC